MSAALVRKSLLLVDPSFNSCKSQKKKLALDFLPDDKKQSKKTHKKNTKAKKADLLQKINKPSITDVRKKTKSKQTILESNLKKLELIKKICTINLEKEITSQLFKRAVTKRPVQLKSKHRRKKEEPTAFTEADFKRFEEEYMAS